MHKFKIGEIVTLVKNNSMAARIGATGMVMGYEKPWDTEYVTIKWLRNHLDLGQYDGGYDIDNFTCLNTEWDE